MNFTFGYIKSGLKQVWSETGQKLKKLALLGSNFSQRILPTLILLCEIRFWPCSIFVQIQDGRLSMDFWKSWNSKFKKKVDTDVQINGLTDNQSIANGFGNHFASVYVNFSGNLDAINEFNLSYRKLSKDNLIISSNSRLSVEIVDKCVKLLKCGKAAGPDGLMAEHILHSHPIITMHICNLFKAMATHNVVLMILSWVS